MAHPQIVIRQPHITLPYIEDWDKASKEIGRFIAGQIVGVSNNGGLVGASGGADSTLTLKFTQLGLDDHNAEHGTDLIVEAHVLPTNLNRPENSFHNMDLTAGGWSVARRMGVPCYETNLQPWVEVAEKSIPEAVRKAYDRGNTISEIRGLVLRRIAAARRLSVIGTGNKDEDFTIGYYTLYGDGAVHMSPLKELSKRLVYEGLRHHGFSDIACIEPTAGLEKKQTDFGNLGFRYSLAELVMRGYYHHGLTQEDLKRHHEVLPMAEAQIAEYARVFGQKKFTAVEPMIDDIFQRHKMALSKAQIVNPPGPTMTTLIYR